MASEIIFTVLVINVFVMIIQYLDELLTQLSDIVEKHSDVNVSMWVVLVNTGVLISVTSNFFLQRDSCVLKTSPGES